MVSRESIELVFLAALQHLPSKQRAILILRDLLDWSARETAELLEMSVASVNSAHQRARATMRARLPASQAGTAPALAPTDEERTVLQTFMDAWEQADADRMTALLREDARWAMPPAPLWFDGRGAIERLFQLFPISFQGSFRMLPIRANAQPAAAIYLRAHGDDAYRLTGIHVLRVADERIAEITTFSAPLCKAFELPDAL